MRILTGIVTFNPQMERLQENIQAIRNQDTDVLIFDNGSDNQDEVSNFAKKNRCKVICADENKGIAYGLGAIMDYAKAHEYDWVLTLDQDSVAEPQLIDNYKKYSNSNSVGALTCIIRDRNFVDTDKDVYNSKNNCIFSHIGKCITSGCFMRVSAYENTPGYDVGMFIDSVDFDICYALRAAGYTIARIPYVGLLHEVGKGFNVSFLGKKYIMYNEKPWRRFYMMRNEIYVARKFPALQSPFITTLRCLWHICLVFIYEGDKFAKLQNGIKGVISGLTMKVPVNSRKI